MHRRGTGRRVPGHENPWTAALARRARPRRRPAQASEHPSPGAAGLGDYLDPTLGNGGYDVQHYDLDLRYATSAPSQPIDGTVTILARATQSLSRFDLDFAGQSVGDVARQRRRAPVRAATARSW